MGGAELLCPGELPVVQVHSDDGVGSRQSGPGDGRITHSTAAENRYRVAPAHVARVHGGADTGHDAAAHESRCFRAGLRGYFDRLPGVH